MDSRAVEDAPRGRAQALRIFELATRSRLTRKPVRRNAMKRTAQELANQIGARVEGHGSVELLGIAAPERAAASDLIYVDSLKNTPRAATSSAACVIALDGLDLPGKT